MTTKRQTTTTSTSRTPKNGAVPTARTRKQRSAEERIADLEAEIERVKRREATKRARQSEDGKAAVFAARALSKAIESAAAAGNEPLRKAAEAAHARLAEGFVEVGLRMPQQRKQKG